VAVEPGDTAVRVFIDRVGTWLGPTDLATVDALIMAGVAQL
jgi:hypothetical protein